MLWNYRNAKKLLNFQKFKWKRKIFKNLRVLNSDLAVGNYSAPHQIKSSYVSRTKIFELRYTGIYIHLHSKFSKMVVFGRLEMVPCNFFSNTNQKTCFWLCCWSILFVVLGEFFLAKLYCKMCDLFCYFLYASRVSTTKFEISI